MERQPYDSDLTDAEWAIIEPLLPPKKIGGRPPDHTRREILNAIFYIARTGCQWRYLPHDFPPYQSVYNYFREWRDGGALEKIHDDLRKLVRVASGKKRGADSRAA
jgi:putative transposase